MKKIYNEALQYKRFLAYLIANDNATSEFERKALYEKYNLYELDD